MAARIVSGLVAAGLGIWACFAGPLQFAAFIAFLALVCAVEWSTAFLRSEGRRASAVFNAGLAVLGAFYPVALYLAASRRAFQPQLLDALLPVLAAGVLALLTVRAARTGKALGDMRRIYGLIGGIYIGYLSGSLVALRLTPGKVMVQPLGLADRGAWQTLLVAGCVWAADTLAFAGGKLAGRRKMAPGISPGKTWEGFAAGLVGALIAGSLLGGWFHAGLARGAAAGALAGVVGPLGDLWESAVKRELGLKDFGVVMPGHGGALDRLDSLLFVAPAAYLLLRLAAG